jgi:23S rRNA (pseudouridine1915-N3)-methyltransferase
VAKLRLYCFGKAPKWLKQQEDDYKKRVKRWAFEVIELKESKEKDKEKHLELEAKLFREKAKDFYWIVMAEEGQVLSSVGLAGQMEKWLENERKDIAFLIGSSYGIAEKLKNESIFKYSLTPLTLTHDHARLILVEQFYRAQCIIEKHPYHHV